MSSVGKLQAETMATRLPSKFVERTDGNKILGRGPSAPG